jgi:hypothetical protein
VAETTQVRILVTAELCSLSRHDQPRFEWMIMQVE